MNLEVMTSEKRLEMQRKRYAYFKEIAEKYNSFQSFIKDNDEKFAIVGIELEGDEESASLYIQLNYTDYELYYIIQKPSGQLTCSPVIWYQDEYCCNSLRNVVTGEYVEEDVDDVDNMESI